jgi:hypothetical protein
MKWLVEDMSNVYDSVIVEAPDRDAAEVIGLEKMFGCPMSDVDKAEEYLEDMIATRYQPKS